MILYLDTSSLVKLYVEEVHADRVKEWVDEAEMVGTCRVAFPETISALDRRFRTGDLSKHDYEMLIDAFTEDWKSFVVLDFNEIESGRLVKKYGLRGFDAVHLSSAILLKGESDLTLTFSSFDEKLNRAATAEGLEVLLP